MSQQGPNFSEGQKRTNPSQIQIRLHNKWKKLNKIWISHESLRGALPRVYLFFNDGLVSGPEEAKSVENSASLESCLHRWLLLLSWHDKHSWELIVLLYKNFKIMKDVVSIFKGYTSLKIQFFMSLSLRHIANLWRAPRRWLSHGPQARPRAARSCRGTGRSPSPRLRTQGRNPRDQTFSKLDITGDNRTTSTCLSF